MKKIVMASLEVPGFHAWEDAPAEVYYLGKQHRHLFRFVVGVNVNGSDREVEFHILRGIVEGIIGTTYLRGPHGFEFGGRSCEMLAEEVIAALQPKGFNVAWVEVWEDRENGSRVEVAS